MGSALPPSPATVSSQNSFLAKGFSNCSIWVTWFTGHVCDSRKEKENGGLIVCMRLQDLLSLCFRYHLRSRNLTHAYEQPNHAGGVCYQTANALRYSHEGAPHATKTPGKHQLHRGGREGGREGRSSGTYNPASTAYQFVFNDSLSLNALVSNVEVAKFVMRWCKEQRSPN